MKRTGNVYNKICELDNIVNAIWKASEEKRDQKRVSKVLEQDVYYAKKIQFMLLNREYIPSDPTIKTIDDASSGKTRTIYKPKFYPDQIIHWALMLQLEPILMKGMYRYSCGSVPKRGTSLGQDTLRKWLDTDHKQTKYCLKMDVKKFYPSINNKILKAMFRRKIKDKDCLWLIDIIIDGNKGQPIGFYTSQWFANFFLESLDHYIKEKLGIKYYIRYVDDLVLLGSNKRKLRKVRIKIVEFLKTIDLKVKENWQVFRTSKRPIDFLGLKFYPNRTTLRARNALRIRRRMRKVRKKGFLNLKDASALISYWGWIKRSDSFYFYHKYIKPIATINTAKKVVRINAKIREDKRGKFVIKLKTA